MRRGSAPDEQPPGQLDTLTVDCPGGAAPALVRARDVLEAVLACSGGEWPELEEWREVLPAWFVASCVDDAEIRDCVVDKWSLRAWIYWFQPGRRKWRWWAAETEGHRLEVQLLVLERPYLRGALEWLLQVSANG